MKHWIESIRRKRQEKKNQIFINSVFEKHKDDDTYRNLRFLHFPIREQWRCSCEPHGHGGKVLAFGSTPLEAYEKMQAKMFSLFHK